MAEVTQNEWSIGERITLVGKFLGRTGIEIYHGVRKNRIPAHQYCYPGIFAALALLAHGDDWVARAYHWKFHLPGGMRNLLVYSALSSGWIIWGVEQAADRNRVIERLRNAFEDARLKSNGQYPGIIEDSEIDEHLRRLRLRTNGVTKSEFEAAIEKLESHLNVSIVRILQEPGDKSRIDLLYTTSDLPKIAHVESPDRLTDGEIPIGLGYTGPISVNIRDVGHILVSGQTGGGKSNFLKLLVSILARNNPDARIIFLDFKGGMESIDLKQEIGNIHQNIEYREGSRECIQELGRLGEDLDGRLTHLKESGASNLDDYLKRRLTKEAGGDPGRVDKNEKRTFIVIDEMAQLASKEPGIDKTVAEKARAAVNRIARQGRAAGVHLIIATQKPDSASFDQTVKANLPGILCFPMTNQAASVSALGNKRAYELNPEIKGRAIWKYGPKMEEVQTYLFT